MAIPYLCLDTGFIYDPGVKLDRLMSDFYESEWSQSYLFQGAITSFPYLVEVNQADPDTMVTTLRQALDNYLAKYYDSLEIQVAKMESESSVSYNLEMYLTVTQETDVVKLYEQIRINGTQLERSLTTRTTGKISL